MKEFKPFVRFQARIGASALLLLTLMSLCFFAPRQWMQWRGVSPIVCTAYFDHVGDLRVNAPVKLAGVVLGRVTEVKLDLERMKAKVAFTIDQPYSKHIPVTTKVSVTSPIFMGESSLELQLSQNFSGDVEVISDGFQFIKTQSVRPLQDLAAPLMAWFQK